MKIPSGFSLCLSGYPKKFAALFRANSFRRKITFIANFGITSLLISLSPFAYSASFSLPLSAKVLSLQKDSGIVFINKGSAEGIKEKNKIIVLAYGKNIVLTAGESFTHTSKLFLQDNSDIQYLKEGEVLSI